MHHLEMNTKITSCKELHLTMTKCKLQIKHIPSIEAPHVATPENAISRKRKRNTVVESNLDGKRYRMSLILETTLGDMTVDLYINQCPFTCYNFMKLCKAKYYNMVVFHSVIKDFVAQTGDPTGKGDGGTSIFGLMEGKEKRWYKEVRLQTGMKHDRPGLLSMVHCGDNMFGSQFVITLGSDLHSLDGEHIVFGEVVDGDDILLKFNETITDNAHRPYKDIRIAHVVIVDDPFEDPDMVFPPSPAVNEEELKDSRIAPHEADSEDGLTETEKQERLKDKEAKAQATILEIVGDLPSYDVAPPENVLFVCRLNPVTTEEDLEIIFSRFGKIMSAEVIRDRKTGDSLQYAFIEFEDKQSCENAYMKMEGVLIDERRIHVDFSQSVAKRIKWNGKGRGVTLSKEEEALQEKEKRRGRKSSPGKDSAGCSSWDTQRDSVPCETNSRDKAKRDQQSKDDKCRMNSKKDNKREEELNDSQRKKDPKQPSKCREEPLGKSANNSSHKGKHNEKQKHLVHNTATAKRDTSQHKINKQGSESSEEEKSSSSKDHRSCGLQSRKHKTSEDRRSELEIKNVSQSKEHKRQDSNKREKEVGRYTSDKCEKGSSGGGSSSSKSATGTKELGRGGYSLHKGEKVSYTSQHKQDKRSMAKNPINSKKMKLDESEKGYVNKKTQKKKKKRRRYPSSSSSSDSSDIETPKEKTAKKQRKIKKVTKLSK